MQAECHIADITLELDHWNLLPTIVFRTARAQCDIDVQRAGNNKRMALPLMQQREIRQAINDVIESYDMDPDIIKTHPHYPALIKTGIGAHHAGQLLMWRLLLEELMAAGLLRVLVATGTVAAGVDFPARTVVITAHSKRGAHGYKDLTAAEFQQMSGRAGRRGKDAVGFCVAAPSLFCDARELLKTSKKPPEPLVSAYFPSPSTVLNLLRYRNVDDLRYTVERSLAAFMDRKNAEQLLKESGEAEQRGEEVAKIRDTLEGKPREQKKNEAAKLRKKARRLANQAELLKGRQTAMLENSLNGLEQLGHISSMSLSAKGYWAANLCTSVVLELAEIIESGFLNDVSTERMVAVVASICGDEHRQYLKTKEPPISKEDIEALSAILDRIKKLEMPGLVDDRVVVPNAAFTAVSWLKAESWQEFRLMLLASGAAEGDAARLMTQTAEHLNQLSRLSDTHPQIALRAEEGKRRILRPPLTEAINLE